MTAIELLRSKAMEAGIRPLDLIYGPYAAGLRAELASLIYGRKLSKSDKLCQYGRLRQKLIELVGATGTCIAVFDDNCNQLIMA